MLADGDSNKWSKNRKTEWPILIQNTGITCISFKGWEDPVFYKQSQWWLWWAPIFINPNVQRRRWLGYSHQYGTGNQLQSTMRTLRSLQMMGIPCILVHWVITIWADMTFFTAQGWIMDSGAKPLNVDFPLNIKHADDVFFVPFREGAFCLLFQIWSGWFIWYERYLQDGVFTDPSSKKNSWLNGITRIEGLVKPDYTNYSVTLLNTKSGKLLIRPI